MYPIKVSKNTEFDVLYDDGTSKHVQEGVLLEAEDNEMVFHNGTNRPLVLFAAAEALIDIISMLGLLPAFDEYLNSRPMSEQSEH